MSQSKKIAYYHLPGLFEFYELYRVFLPLFRRHREYFYEWCDIGSIYGAPGGLHLGRRTCRRRSMHCAGGAGTDAGIWHFRQIGPSAIPCFGRSTFPTGGAMDYAACSRRKTGRQAAVIVHSDLLLEYLRAQLPLPLFCVLHDQGC